ncbi:hypothetical protein [Yimella sp. NH-Cas1]|uniref:hypothetical protein n=1 Tax=Yimella sp. NH-Cas1 TaxID=2917726 RepID=UPI001EFA3595|nr:hypothetical protein [Yimella sp. NH-Cas1]MCG8655549.1 hypothetical protein [Yimella sp. NH-Cas1]
MSDESKEWNSDFGSTELDPQERRDAETYLDDPNDSDDEPWTPPERQPRAGEFLDDDEEETIDQRIGQEIPEEGTAYGAPEEEAEALRDDAMAGGDDPDAIPADQDFIGDPDEVDDSAYQRRDETEPAEEAALHVVDDDEQSPDEEDVDIEDEDVEFED